ncbi:MAG: zinc-dependent metalloprotease [Rikenellaceae bacterium]|jgi:hypothetical protein|nr:zinc-dependent metalloprotease [Rikenellaceae bacterium]
MKKFNLRPSVASTLILACMLGFLNSSAVARKKDKTATVAADTTARKPTPPAGSIEAVIKSGARQTTGMLTVIEQEDKFYFLIPTSLLQKDMLIVNRLIKAPAEKRNSYSGDEIYEEMIRLAESPNGKRLFIERVATRDLPRDTVGEMYRSVMRSNMQPLIASFEIKARSKAKDSLLVDATDLVNGDNELFSFDANYKIMEGLTSLQGDKSYIRSIRAFPINTEIRTVKTFAYTPERQPGSTRQPASTPMTYEINTSIVVLPDVPMQPRYADARVGYFTNRYVDFDKNPQGIKNMEMISRWRLEPKPEDMEKYKRGELVEPVRPIIFYIDPATPQKWVPYLIAGVNDWQTAFEKAGFKNAILGLEAPTAEQDSTWSLEDARFSAIVYKPSDIANASGPHVSDPRTGQIMESHINWYHNVMSLLHHWYMIQTGPTDPGARTMVFDDALMGDLIRFVSSHEVGHTLGLRHNFGSSAMTPTDSLRSAAFLAMNGHTASIMDYARFNYVAQPEDKIARQLLYPRIGDYDKWAIEWGYRRFPGVSADDEAAKLNEWIISALKNPRNYFLSEESSRTPNDPRSQTEDLGDDQMKSNAYGIKNLKVVMAGLPVWTAVPNEGYANLRTLHNEVVEQYYRYIGHVEKWVGGIYETPKTIEQPGSVYAYVEKVRQQEAMKFLDEQFFTTPSWLFDQAILEKTGNVATDLMTMLCVNNLPRLVSARVLGNMISAEAAIGKQAYTMTEFYNDLNRMVWSELSNGRTPDTYRRILQKAYVETLIARAGLDAAARSAPANVAMQVSDIRSYALSQLRALMGRLSAAAPADPVTRAHYQYLAAEIKNAIDGNK